MATSNQTANDGIVDNIEARMKAYVRTIFIEAHKHIRDAASRRWCTSSPHFSHRPPPPFLEQLPSEQNLMLFLNFPNAAKRSHAAQQAIERSTEWLKTYLPERMRNMDHNAQRSRNC